MRFNLNKDVDEWSGKCINVHEHTQKPNNKQPIEFTPFNQSHKRVLS